MINRFVDWSIRWDLPYRILACIEIGLGITIWLSLLAPDTVISWMADQYGFSEQVFGGWGIVAGLIVLTHRATRHEFVVLFLPVWLYILGVTGFILVFHRGSTVVVLYFLFALLVLAIIRLGFKPL